MAKITAISLRADVSRNCVSDIKKILRYENPKASVTVKCGSEFRLSCDIESEKSDNVFNVTAPMIERNLASRVNQLINYYNYQDQ